MQPGKPEALIISMRSDKYLLGDLQQDLVIMLSGSSELLMVVFCSKKMPPQPEFDQDQETAVQLYCGYCREKLERGWRHINQIIPLG